MMTDRDADLPERLQIVGATDLEQRLLQAAAREQPSPALSERMASAIGIAMAGPGAPSAGASLGAAGSKAGAGALAPWLAGGVLALVVAGALVGPRVWRASERPAPRLPAVTVPTPPPALPATNASVQATAPGTEEKPAASAPVHRRAASAPAGDLRDQIALLDNARAAIAAGSADQALELLRRYADRYPAGSFRPEAAALRIEAMVKSGRTDEARMLAERFIAEHGASPLSERVRRLAGLDRP
jgi:TolA-binding protein